MLACTLDPKKFEVSVYERNAALGRKFLVAGEGGLNLTHSENKKEFIQRYTPSDFLQKAFAHFSNEDLVTWINTLGIETYVGSSGRVFPKRGVKPVEVLNRTLDQLKRQQVNVLTKHVWKGLAAKDTLVFEHNGKLESVEADIVVFCLGGASWPVTGSKGEWTSIFEEKQIKVHAFRASNSSFRIDWPDTVLSKIEGRALKNIRITCDQQTHAGEIVLTRTGIEGSGIYPLSPAIRSLLGKKGKAKILIDLKPLIDTEKLEERLRAKPTSTNTTSFLKSAMNFDTVQIELLKLVLPKAEFLDPHSLAKCIKALPLDIVATGPLEDAISSVGGLALEEINEHFELKKWPSHYAIGEMLDYDAPTGGYLLQSCFSMANYLAWHLNTRFC